MTALECGGEIVGAAEAGGINFPGYVECDFIVSWSFLLIWLALWECAVRSDFLQG